MTQQIKTLCSYLLNSHKIGIKILFVLFEGILYTEGYYCHTKIKNAHVKCNIQI